MKNFGRLLVLAIGLLLLNVYAQSPAQLSGSFMATVRMGPNKDLKLQGTLKLNLSSNGVVNGTLEVPGGAPVKVTGTAVNQSINLAFDLGQQKILGTGTIDYDWFRDPTIMGGTFVGPYQAGPDFIGNGNIGDWVFVIKKP